jgi:hypothetical protein
VIQLQQACGNPSDCGETFYAAFREAKMIRPSVAAWMKERDEVAGLFINGREIASFKAIAQGTREAKIVFGCLPAMLLGNQMIDFVRDKSH